MLAGELSAMTRWDADLTLVDPNGSTTIDRLRLHSKQHQSPWHGRQLRGAIKRAILRGEVVARDAEPIGPPRGRLVRAMHGPRATAGRVDPSGRMSKPD
jgi:hypothetical protein